MDSAEIIFALSVVFVLIFLLLSERDDPGSWGL